MVKELIGLLKRPALWERSEALFWDDEHISEQMLKAHLSPGTDAASRRPETIERSVKWLCEVIPSGSRLLDLGCGPGLYAARLSERGYPVTGVDMSRRSIAYARERDPSGEYICGNYLELNHTAEFDAVTMIYCDYAALTEPERKALLGKVMKALKPGGLFIFDVFTDVCFGRKSESTSWEICASDGGFWSAEPYVCLQAVCLYSGGMVAADVYAVVTDSGVARHIIWDAAFTAQTLKDELSASGFRAEGFFDDICGSPYTGRADTLCCVARRG